MTTVKNTFNLYPLLIAIMVTSQILCFIFARRQIDLFTLPTNISGIIFPLDLYIVEIIGECYGYEYSRQSVWINTAVHFIFLSVVFVVSIIPYSTFMHQDLIFSYQHLIDISTFVVFGSLCGTFLGDMFSARFVPQTKIILNGKYTFLRLFFSQLISEAIVTSSYFISFLTNNYSFIQTLHLIINTILIKSTIAILLWPVARFIIKMIKSHEKIEGFDYQQDYKTLAFAIDNDLINIKNV
jgi:uncharacterized PurR-regulated membrane protein YhhQ (DUF165 family)